MAEWTIISIDKDDTQLKTVGFTGAIKVPGGMIIRTVVQDHGTSMVFVPIKEIMVGQDYSSIDEWIKKNKVL